MPEGGRATRRPLVAGNWKMHTTLAEARALAAAVTAGALPDVDVVVCPPFPWLLPVAERVAGTTVEVGAQNCWRDASGAYTGEVSPTMLAGLCRYVIIGHSERRRLVGESDELVAAKVAAARRAGLRPIVCVGEDLGQRRAGAARDVVTGQLSTALAGIEPADLSACVVAYEPVWAIGTGVAATPDDAAVMAGVIREVVRGIERPAGDAVRVLYGGSVTPDNAAALLGAVDVDGALVGGASLQADAFLAIVRAAAR